MDLFSRLKSQNNSAQNNQVFNEIKIKLDDIKNSSFVDNSKNIKTNQKIINKFKINKNENKTFNALNKNEFSFELSVKLIIKKLKI
jgi:hypothetical protein